MADVEPAQAVAKPRQYGMLLFPGFQLLDVAGPLDALHGLARRDKVDLAIIAATMDPVTTAEGPPGLNPFNSSFAVTINPTHTFETVPPLDVLFVPGGQGTRVAGLESTMKFIAETYPKLQFLITVCTGSGLVAKSGILDGRRATTNKASFQEVVNWRPQVNWVGHARWVVDGNIWSSSGISAGIDVTLALIEHLYGDETATSISNRMEYNRERDSTRDAFAEIWKVPKSGS